MKPKTERPFCKYALKMSFLREDKRIDFRNLNGFYDEIISKDKTIKIDKNLINKIKKFSIKELIYSNKSIPFSWKNKFNYKNQVINLISKDDKFLSYLGRTPPKNIFKEKLPKINNKMKLKSENNIFMKKNFSFHEKKIKKEFEFNKKKEIDNDEIKAILEDYKVNYPIDDNAENSSASFKRNKIFGVDHPKGIYSSINNKNRRNYFNFHNYINEKFEKIH